MTTTRRTFLSQTAAVAAAVPFLDRFEHAAAAVGRLGAVEKTPFPYVDGLSFIGAPEDVPACGLSAFIMDVSAAESIKTTDGSVKFYRSFEACTRQITAMRRDLTAGKISTAFLATKGSEIREAHRAGRTAVFFQFQGCEPIGEDLSRLEQFYGLGLRVLQITHHNNNPWGGGAIERTWSGLTKTGFAGVERLNTLGIIPDLSHVSDPTSRDVLRVSKKPVIVSHGGARALVNSARCTPDDVIKGVANSGGMMGVFMMSCWLTTDAVPTTEAYIRQIRHIANVGGIGAVGIANDYPLGGELSARQAGNDNAKVVSGMYPWWDSVGKEGVLGFDKRPTHMVIPELNNPRRAFKIHEALDKAGYKTGDIEKIMGGNWIRVLTGTLG